MTALRVAIALCLAVSTARADALPPGDHEVRLAHDGLDRYYLVHVPAGAGRPLPVLLDLHGGGGNAEGERAGSGLVALSERAGFLLVHPAGSLGVGKRLLTWNAGTCCGPAQARGVDDVGFLLRVLDDLAARTPIDAARVYATGLSNGAMMSHRLAREAPARIAAIAPVAGIVDLGPVPAGPPVAVLQIHSVDDPRALYAGGLGPPFPMTQHRSVHAPVEAALRRWIDAGACKEPPRQEPERTSGAQRAERLVWSGCRGGAEVALVRLHGVGHVWPGQPSRLPERLVGPPTTVIDAAEEVWAFVSRFSRAEPAPVAVGAPPGRVVTGRPAGPGPLSELALAASGFGVRASGVSPRDVAAPVGRLAWGTLELEGAVSAFGHASAGAGGLRGWSVLLGARAALVRPQTNLLGADPLLLQAHLSAGLVLLRGRDVYLVQAGAGLSEDRRTLGDAEPFPFALGLGTAGVGAASRLVYGGAYAEVFGQRTLLPILGIVTPLGEGGQLRVLLPLVARATFAVGERLSLGAQARLAGHQARIANDGVFAGAASRLRLRSGELRTGALVRYRVTQALALEGELGVAAPRRLVVSDGDRDVLDTRPAPAGFAGISLRYEQIELGGLGE